MLATAALACMPLPAHRYPTCSYLICLIGPYRSRFVPHWDLLKAVSAGISRRLGSRMRPKQRPKQRQKRRSGIGRVLGSRPRPSQAFSGLPRPLGDRERERGLSGGVDPVWDGTGWDGTGWDGLAPACVRIGRNWKTLEGLEKIYTQPQRSAAD